MLLTRGATLFVHGILHLSSRFEDPKNSRQAAAHSLLPRTDHLMVLALRNHPALTPHADAVPNRANLRIGARLTLISPLLLTVALTDSPNYPT